MNFLRTQCVTLYACLCIAFFASDNAWAGAALPQDNSKAVILAYHRIGEDHIPDQSLTTQRFREHVEELLNGKYNVIPLGKAVAAITENQPLPERTVVITFEGAYTSSAQNALPLLIEHNLPFTVFYASDTLDQKDPAHTTWEQLKTFDKNENITLGVLPASYTHTAHQSRQDALSNLNKSRQRYRENFKNEALFLSYPYGEYSQELKELAKTQGFKAAFGLQSGAIYTGSDIYALPRFSMTDSYGDLERFRLVTGALPLPVSELEPTETLLDNVPFFTGFTLPTELKNSAKNMSCFISGQTKPQTEILGTRVEIRSDSPLHHLRRIRLNCTMPGPLSQNDEIQWRWFGVLYHRPENQVAEISNPRQDELPEPRE